MAKEQDGRQPAVASLNGQRYRCLLFDADGTLFDYDRAESSALAQVFEQNGLAYDPAYLPVYREVNQLVWQMLEKKQLTSDILKLRRFELLLERIGVAQPAENFSERYLRCLANCSELVDGADGFLKGIAGKYRVAIVTNGLRSVQRSRLERSTIRDHIEAMIISEEIGHSKPAAEFFDLAFARLGNPAKGEVLMVGDSWTADIEGAARYGIDACWYNPKRLPRPASPPIAREVASFAELRQWLG
jgi:2-haloacid dehalogenase